MEENYRNKNFKNYFGPVKVVENEYQVGRNDEIQVVIQGKDQATKNELACS